MGLGFAAEQLVYSLETGTGLSVAALPLPEEGRKAFDLARQVPLPEEGRKAFDLAPEVELWLARTFGPSVLITSLDRKKLFQIVALIADQDAPKPEVNLPIEFLAINHPDFLARSEKVDPSSKEVATSVVEDGVFPALGSPWRGSIRLDDLLKGPLPVAAVLFLSGDHPVIALVGASVIYFLMPSLHEGRMWLRDWVRWLRRRIAPPPVT
jgi:hypothetical protein